MDDFLWEEDELEWEEALPEDSLDPGEAFSAAGNPGLEDSVDIFQEDDPTQIPDSIANFADFNADEQVGTLDGIPLSQDIYDHFNPAATDSDDVIGDPGTGMTHWHEQTRVDTCGVVSQEFILDDVFDRDFTEPELREIATSEGWYTPGGGTPLPEMGRLLEYFNLEVDYQEGCTLEDLSQKLDEGQKVIVALDSDEVWNPGAADDDLLYSRWGLPGQDANHAVQVIGIDNSDPEHPSIILNDPGMAEGQGLMVPADTFMDAWEDSNHYTVSTTGEVVQNVGNYYDQWGVYYYDDHTVLPGYDWYNGYY